MVAVITSVTGDRPFKSKALKTISELKGKTVAASLNAPTLFTLVNDLTKMRIVASVAEADVGAVEAGQTTLRFRDVNVGVVERLDLSPDLRNVIVTVRVRKDVAQYIDDGVFDGGQILSADMTTGFVGIGYGEDGATQQVSDALKAEVAALADQIIAGEIVVESTR